MNDVTNENPIMVINDDNVVNLKRVAEEEKKKNLFLPYMKLTLPRENNNRFILVVNGLETILSVFYLIHIATRNFCRQLIGNVYSNRVYEGGVSDPQYKEVVGKLNEEEEEIQGWQQGFSHLVCLLQGEEPLFCSMEFAGNSKNFLTVPLSEASFLDKKMVSFPETALEKCKVQSKNGFFYYASYYLSFNEHKLNETIIKKIKAQAIGQKEQINRWLSQ